MKKTLAVALSSLMTFLFMFNLSQDVLAQNTGNTLWKITYPDEPVEITDLSVEWKGIEFGKAFSAQQDWLRTLRFNVKNTSDKVINYVEFHVLIQYPESKKTANAIDVTAGFFTSDDNPVDRNNQAIYLQPGQVVSLYVNEKRYRNFLQMIIEANAENQSMKISLLIARVQTEDHSMWTVGEWYAPDPANSKKWLKLKISRPTSYVTPNNVKPFSNASTNSVVQNNKNTVEENYCYVPDDIPIMQYECLESVNECSPTICSRYVNRLKLHPEGVYFRLVTQIMCLDCQGDYCGYALQMTAIPGCDPILPLRSPVKFSKVAKTKNEQPQPEIRSAN